jgi:hypothetical protein
MVSIQALHCKAYFGAPRRSGGADVSFNLPATAQNRRRYDVPEHPEDIIDFQNFEPRRRRRVVRVSCRLQRVDVIDADRR